MNITVKAEAPADNKLVAQVTVAQADVDAAVKKAYKEVANRYNFQGFRRGKAPRPIIDNMVGREYVLGIATEEVVREAEPLLVNELDVVACGDIDYSEVEAVAEGADFTYQVTIPLIPTAELSSTDAVEIEMPPAGATDDEIKAQVDLLLAYSTTFEDAPEGATVADDDIVTFAIEDVEGAERFASDSRVYTIGSPVMPAEFYDAVKGMAVGDAKEVSWTPEGDEAPVKANVTVKLIRQRHTPELTDELVKENFGFDDVAALNDAVKGEIEADKGRQLPQLKESRALDALVERLQLDEIPEAYEQLVYSELGQTVLNQVSQAGMSLDQYLAQRGIAAESFVADLHEQAKERARQSIALDALAAKLGLEATAEDIVDQIKEAGVEAEEAIASMRAQLEADGRIPAVRASIRRSKALDWLLDNAKVTEVEESADIVPNDEPADEPEAEAPAEEAAEE